MFLFVHEKWYDNHLIEITARYTDDYEEWINGDRYTGLVLLSCNIINNTGDTIKTSNNHSEVFSSDENHTIRFQRKVDRYGFMKLKRKYSVIHIADEYERVLPLFLEYCREIVDRLARKQKRDIDCKKITDGLPDSLRDL